MMIAKTVELFSSLCKGVGWEVGTEGDPENHAVV